MASASPSTAQTRWLKWDRNTFSSNVTVFARSRRTSICALLTNAVIVVWPRNSKPASVTGGPSSWREMNPFRATRRTGGLLGWHCVLLARRAVGCVRFSGSWRRPGFCPSVSGSGASIYDWRRGRICTLEPRQSHVVLPAPTGDLGGFSRHRIEVLERNSAAGGAV